METSKWLNIFSLNSKSVSKPAIFFRFSIPKIEDGYYSFRVQTTSLAQYGAFTEWRDFKVSKQKNETQLGLILFITFLFLALIVGISASFYYKHNIICSLRNQNDTAFLINEMEPTDFNELSLNNNSFAQLSNITEQDEE